jgi:hypothetical protein
MDGHRNSEFAFTRPKSPQQEFEAVNKILWYAATTNQNKLRISDRMVQMSWDLYDISCPGMVPPVFHIRT